MAVVMEWPERDSGGHNGANRVAVTGSWSMSPLAGGTPTKSEIPADTYRHRTHQCRVKLPHRIAFVRKCLLSELTVSVSNIAICCLVEAETSLELRSSAAKQRGAAHRPITAAEKLNRVNNREPWLYTN